MNFQRVSQLIWCIVFSWASHGLSAETIPYLISIQPTRTLEAWKDVAELIAQNEKLENPLPDPYLARAELWTTVGAHEDAVEDYLQASSLIMKKNPSLIEQAKVFKSLRESLERLSQSPRPAYPIKAADACQTGFEYYYRGDFKQALPFFVEATRLNPDDAVYRAMRGLSSYRLGDIAAAEKQVAAAANIVRKQGFVFPDSREQDFHRRLERIQGTDRRWLSNGMLNAGIENKSLNNQADQFLAGHESTAR